MLGFLTAVALMLGACHPEGEAQHRGPVPPPVTGGVMDVQAVDLDVFEQVVGTVQPEFQATISAKVTGRILERKVVPGQQVAAGDLLVRIETPELEAALARAEASLGNAQSEVERFRRLEGSGSVSQREIDRAETQLRVAQAERNRIRSQLDEATVAAPFAGRVTREYVDPGDLVQPGSPLCRIEDPTQLRLEIHVAESLASSLSRGDVIPVHIEAPDLGLEGTVAEISPAADAASRTFLVKLNLPTEEGLRAGQFGRAFVTRGQKRSLVVPGSALLSRGQLTYVGVVDATDTVRLRIVRTGGERPDGVEILAGLEAGERILVEPPADLRDGAALKSAGS